MVTIPYIACDHCEGSRIFPTDLLDISDFQVGIVIAVEVVEADHGMAFLEEPFAKMRADKTCSARDQDRFHHSPFNFRGYFTIRARPEAIRGRIKIVFIAMGTPQRSAIIPRRVTPIPPALMVNPTIIPEAIPKCWGRTAWPITVVRAKDESKTIPAIPRRIKEMNPLL